METHLNCCLIGLTGLQVWWACGGVTPAVGAAIAPATHVDPMSLKLECVGESRLTCYHFSLCTNPCAVFLCTYTTYMPPALQICHKGSPQLQVAAQIVSGECITHKMHSQSVARLVEVCKDPWYILSSHCSFVQK